MAGERSVRLMGGVFGLNDGWISDYAPPPFIVGREVCLANARSGVALLVKALDPPQFWMPSYTCQALMDSVAEVECAVRFFPVDDHLGISSTGWLTDVGRGDLVLLIDYFGFEHDRAVAEAVRDRGAHVLEDASQALLSEFVERAGHFVLLSPIKFVGVPDGGLLRYPASFATLTDIHLRESPRDWWAKSFFSCLLRGEFDRHGGSRRWFDLFLEADAEGPVGPYRMSELSQFLLGKCFDYSAIARTRIENYLRLLSRLTDVAIFKELPEGVVPLGFPIRLRHRDAVREVLYRHEIYPPVHWPLQDIVPEEFGDSHRLSGEIMTLPCDQRYDVHDMEWMAEIVLNAASL